MCRYSPSCRRSRCSVEQRLAIAHGVVPESDGFGLIVRVNRLDPPVPVGLQGALSGEGLPLRQVERTLSAR